MLWAQKTARSFALWKIRALLKRGEATTVKSLTAALNGSQCDLLARFKARFDSPNAIRHAGSPVRISLLISSKAIALVLHQPKVVGVSKRAPSISG
jgi:hypothetical protein